MFGKIIDALTQPIVDAVDVVDGLTDGEIREKAALRLGADVISGMAIAEIIDLLKETEKE